MSSQNNKKKVANHFCRHCSYGFGSEKLLNQHKEKGCMATKGQQVKMPELDADNPDKFYIKFKNHYKKRKAPFVIYADFECLTEKYGTVSTKVKNTDAYQKHTPCGYMINVVTSITGSSEPYLYRGEDCIDVFTKKMIEVKNDILNRMKTTNEDIKMKEADWEDFNNTTHCFICGCKFKS